MTYNPSQSRENDPAKNTEHGQCKLTLTHGRYVKSHIIPRAFTKPEWKGASWLQSGESSRAVRRWDSWYDKSLVTREGEDILARYDDWAAQELRQHKLTWSSWGPMQKLSARDFKQIPRTKLRLFFLSLLWRAAASNMKDFSSIRIDASDLERIRTMVLNGRAEPFEFYPIALVQLSTIGEVHNLTPLMEDKLVPQLKQNGRDLDDKASSTRIPIVRFYFDGLIAHIHRDPAVDRESMGKTMIGYDPTDLWINTVTYEASFEFQNLEALKAGVVLPPPS